jgi:DNA helicase-2/ATP-dependent DNA helicase PcrA
MSPTGFAAIAHHPLEVLAADVYDRYEKRLKKMSGLDFDDLLIRPLQAFQEHPEFLERLRYRYKYVMVDEFQDTNPAQYQLIKAIASGRRNLCVVGDDDQAIYGFRGATVANILEFKRDWHDVKVIHLEQNYRSHKYILDIAWAVIKRNSHRHEKKLWTARLDGEPARLIEARSDDEEAMLFTSFIQTEKSKSDWSLRDFAILYRTNAQSLPFERALRAAGLPYQVIGGLKFYERKEIKDILAYLRVLVNPADDISLDRIINYPPRGIGERLMAELQMRAVAEGRTLLEQVLLAEPDLSHTPRSRKALSEFLSLIARFSALMATLPFPELVKHLIVETGLRERLREEEKEDPSRAESKVANLDSLTADIARFAEEHPDLGVADFLEEVSLVTDADAMDQSKDRVNMMTIHAAKGLEFPAVLIGGLEEGLLPLTPPDGSSAEIEEERRLFFVGVTRAMDKLVLGYAVERLRYGTRLWLGPSRFLREIPPELLQVKSRPTYGADPVRSIRKQPAERIGRSKPPNYTSTKEPAPSGIPMGAAVVLDDLRKGLLVKHPAYGLGVITDFRRAGDDSRVEVDFDDVGSKTLILRLSPLSRVG